MAVARVLRALLPEATSTVVELGATSVLDGLWSGTLLAADARPSDVNADAVVVIGGASAIEHERTTSLLEQAAGMTRGPIMLSVPAGGIIGAMAAPVWPECAGRTDRCDEVAAALHGLGRQTTVLPEGFVPRRIALAEAERDRPDLVTDLRAWYAERIAPHDLRAPSLGWLIIATTDSAPALDDLSATDPEPEDLEALEALTALSRLRTEADRERHIRHVHGVFEKAVNVMAQIPRAESAPSVSSEEKVASRDLTSREWEHRARVAEEKARETRRQLEQAMTSESMRVGRAVTAPTRALARGLRRLRR